MCAASATTQAPLLGGGSGEALVFTDNPEICDAVARIIDNGAVQRVTVLEGGIAAALEAPIPDAPVTLVDISASPDPVTDIAMLSEVANGRIVAMGPVNDVAFFRTLTAAGASDYLVVPPSDDMLIDALTPPKVEVEAEDSDESRIVSVIGARGGVGQQQSGVLAEPVGVEHLWGIAFLVEERGQAGQTSRIIGTATQTMITSSGRPMRQ